MGYIVSTLYSYIELSTPPHSFVKAGESWCGPEGVSVG